MQPVALLIDPLIAWPRPTAASAIPVPTIARIKAYSAAEAPLSFMANDFTKLTILIPLILVHFTKRIRQNAKSRLHELGAKIEPFATLVIY
jgi:hypothetical protein